MDELEALIARAAEAPPGATLDRRVRALIVTATPNRRRPPMTLVVCGTALCAGLLGFAFGARQAATATSQASAHAPAVLPRTVEVRLSDEQLVSLFMPPPPVHGLWGPGTLDVQSSVVSQP